MTLGDAKAILLKNNGLVTVGESVRLVVLRALFLERACQMQLAAETSRYDWGWLPADDGGMRGMTLASPEQVDNFWNYYVRRLDHMERGTPLPGD